MRDIRVHTKQSLSSGAEIILDDFAAKHIGTVLRLNPGKFVTIFNGEGGEFKSTITKVKRNKITLLVGEHVKTTNESPLKIHLGIGISRGDRMDTVIQKSTEVGVTEITPLFTERVGVKLENDKLQNRLTHWQKVCISACEQSHRTKIPIINSPKKIKDWIQSVSAQKKMMLDPKGKKQISTLKNDKSIVDISLLIGPEGGFSISEVEIAKNYKFDQISLGPRILRTETAPTVAISVFQSIWGDIN
ncbi:MAG: 16S rRNA (uracil(1498)-N(3))-methyltransferase [Porticoccus sp.]|jgi:16S rRNA (uracil1498-N3)-methyltransferase|nr:16S rRNA (uracil(1498)-N(3))-methyltransferase [Porticoccus sp.]|tara:strand:+ start:1603 stop:2340 length:738 start_codon:yes stop_codon:yes gene_type:complete